MECRSLFDKILLSHLFVEMYYRGSRTSLFEHFIGEDRNIKAYGVFDGCRELADIIRQNALTALNNGEQELTIGIKSQWFDSVFIEFVDFDAEAAAYVSDNRQVGILNPLRLKITPMMVFSKNAIPALMHELLHAYEDFNRKKGGAESLDDKGARLGYDIYAQVDSKGDKGQIANMLYILTSFETNAFMAQLSVEIFDAVQDERIDTVPEMLKAINALPVKKRIDNALRTLDEIVCEQDRRQQAVLLNYVNNLSKHDFSKFSESCRFLEARKNAVMRKLSDIITKNAFSAWHQHLNRRPSGL